MSDLDWLQALKAGDRVRVERRWSWKAGGRLDHAWTATVARRTPKRAYLNDGRDYIDLATGLVRPAYLDYTTRAVELVTEDTDSSTDSDD